MRTRPSRGTPAPSPPARGSGRPRGPTAQSARSDCARPHGFDARSMSRSIGSASAGKFASTITWWRRRSTMWSTCSIDTGHACTHAPQVTQSQIISSGHVRAEDRLLGLSEHVVPHAHDDELRREHLAGGERRTCVLAAPALGAREAVEHLLERQILGRADAEAQLLLRDAVVVEAQRLEPAAGSRPREPHVDRGGEDVEVLGVRQVGEEAEDREHVRPDEHALEHARRLVVPEQARRARSTPARPTPASR